MAVPETPKTSEHKSLPLKIVIVGGGIGGLAAAIECKEKGFEVIVLEASKEFTHVGAGVFLGANVSQIATHMGIRSEMEKYSASYQRTLFFTFDGAQEINRQDYHEKAKEMGYPLWQMHRADVHIVLEAKAREVGVEIKMGSPVEKYDWKGPSVTTKDGVKHEADVVICADGYKSPARTILSGLKDALRPSGLSAFRFLVPIERLAPYPEMAQIIDWKQQMTHVWTGQGAHALCYPIRQGKVLNVVMNQKEINTTEESYVVPATAALVKERYKGWDARLQRIFDNADDDAILEWKLCDIEPMEDYTFPGGKMILLGDACHAMLPTAAQGAGMSIEDGVAVAEILARIRHVDEIPAALKTYSELRTPRCGDIVRAARGDVKRWHKKEGGVKTDWSWSYDIRKAAQEAPIVITR